MAVFITFWDSPSRGCPVPAARAHPVDGSGSVLALPSRRHLVLPSVARRGGLAGSEGLVSPETHPGFCGSTLVLFSQGAGFRSSSARAGALESGWSPPG